MSKSPADLIREYQLRQESERLSQEVIAQAASPKSSQADNRLGYLVTHFGKRSDLPEYAVLCKMLPKVVRNLAALGLHEPVSLKGLLGKWWLAHVDMAFDDPRMETGGAMVNKVASTEDLLCIFSGYYCEVTARVKVVVASVMQPTVEYDQHPNASL
jgi:hypothetical protein